MTLVKRKLEQVIQNHMFHGKAIILLGARQVGKSILFEQILAELPDDITENQILRINCDDPEQRRFLENANLANLPQQLAGKRIVMVDEAQRIQGIGIKLKLITDHFKDVQLLVIGSSSFMLQGKLNEPLTGR